MCKIVYCNAAALAMHRLLIYCTSTQCTAPQVKINLTLLQYRAAVVGAETEIQALQLFKYDNAYAVDYERTLRLTR